MNNNSNYNNQFSFLDILNVMSFIISLKNLQENMTHTDQQKLMQQFSSVADTLLKEIHQHLQEQDDKIDIILQKLGG